MSVDILKAIDFLGLPATAPDVDDFLQESGATRRLSQKDRPIATLGLSNEAVQFQFSDSYEESYGPPRAKGFLYLEDITVESSKYAEGVGTFEGVLPFGLRLDMTDQDIISTLGEPDYKGEMMGAYFVSYHHYQPKLSVNCRLDKKTREVTFIRFSRPEKD